MDKAISKDYFANLMFKRQFTPAIISAVCLAFGDMADAIVVGQKLGTVGLAAISLALPVFMIFNVLMYGLGIGGAVKYASYLAKGDEETAGQSFQSVIYVAFTIAVAIAVLSNVFLSHIVAFLGASPNSGLLYQTTSEYLRIILSGTPILFLSYIFNYYLRNDDMEKMASVGFTVGNLTDITLNVVFVLVLDMGAAGAAYSTIIGLSVSLMIYLFSIAIRKSNLRLRKYKGIQIKTSEAFACFKIGFSTSSQYLYTMAFIFIANNALMKIFGHEGVAIFDLIQNCTFFSLYLYEAVAKAAQPILSTYFGEQNANGIANIKKISLIVGTTLGLALTIFILFFPHFICALFGIDDAETIALASNALRIFAISICFSGVSSLYELFYQCSECEKTAFVLTSLRGAVVLLPVTTIIYFVSPIHFWLLYPITEILSLVIFWFYQKMGKGATQAFDTTRVYTKRIKSESGEMLSLTSEIEAFCNQFGATMKQTYFVIMTTEELINAILLKGFEKHSGYIEMTIVAKENGDFTLFFRDSAISFNPFSLETAKVGSQEMVDMDAMGILIIKNKAKDFYYRRYQGFNTLVVTI